MDEYAGRVLADRYRLPLPPSDAYELTESRAFDTYSGQEVLVRQVPLPEVVEAEVLDAEGLPDGFTARDRGARRPSGDGAGRPVDPAVRRAVEAAQAAAQIPDHPRLDQVFDVFAEGGSLWIVSEAVPARPLAALLAEQPLTPYRAAEVAADVLMALRVLHAHGWVHRNVTARTVLICDDGRVMLTGLAVGAAEEALCGYDPTPPPVDPHDGAPAVTPGAPALRVTQATADDVEAARRDAINARAAGGLPPASGTERADGRGAAGTFTPPASENGADVRAARAGAIAAYRAGARAAARVQDTQHQRPALPGARPTPRSNDVQATRQQGARRYGAPGQTPGTEPPVSGNGAAQPYAPGTPDSRSPYGVPGQAPGAEPPVSGNGATDPYAPGAPDSRSPYGVPGQTPGTEPPVSGNGAAQPYALGDPDSRSGRPGSEPLPGQIPNPYGVTNPYGVGTQSGRPGTWRGAPPRGADAGAQAPGAADPDVPPPPATPDYGVPQAPGAPVPGLGAAPASGVPVPSPGAPRSTAPGAHPAAPGDPRYSAPGVPVPGSGAPRSTAPGAHPAAPGDPRYSAPGLPAPGSGAPRSTAPGAHPAAPGDPRYSAPGLPAQGPRTPRSTAPGTPAHPDAPSALPPSECSEYPAYPAYPDHPEDSDHSAHPDYLASPDHSAHPDYPAYPDNSAYPDNPEAPDHPRAPDHPGDPGYPEGPEYSEGSDYPGYPEGPDRSGRVAYGSQPPRGWGDLPFSPLPAPRRGPATALDAERARQARMAVVGAVTERWAPEQAGPVHENWQLAAPIGPATDLWALGALLFRAVQGHAPYPEESTAELVQLVCAEPPAFAEECGPLRPVVESLLRQDPTERLDFEELSGWLRSLVRSAPEPEAGTRLVAAPPVDVTRLPIVRRRGELVRRRRAGLPATTPHGRHKRARQGEGSPRKLGRNLLLLVLLLLAGAVAYAMLFMPKAGQQGTGSGTGVAGQASPVPEQSSSRSASGEPSPERSSSEAEASGGATETQTDGIAAGFALRKDAEGFQIAVAKGWQRTPKNGSGQVVYAHGDFELIVVPGRDSAQSYGGDPMAYQRDSERELAPYRDSSWATATGLKTIQVGGRSMAEGQFTWTDDAGHDLYVRNLAILIAGRYHVVQVRGPESDRDQVTRLYEQASATYEVTG
ncbi:protein kinase [Streptomyces sp. NPDC087294]|uniref:protein kinase n=1 Tax=Streptomyces sp. NPDC087294 TaxID=3365777 RepID=UPI00382A7165